jgi:hypothetical protein
MIVSIVEFFSSAIAVDVAFFSNNEFLSSSASALMYFLHLDIASLSFVTIPAVVSGILTFCKIGFFSYPCVIPPLNLVPVCPIVCQLPE